MLRGERSTVLLHLLGRVDSEQDYFIDVINVETGVASETAKPANDVIYGLIDLFDVIGSLTLKPDYYFPWDGVRICSDPRRRLRIGNECSFLVYA